MAIIYNFDSYRAPRMLRKFSRHTEGVSWELCSLGEKLNNINAGLGRIQEAQYAFSSQLDTYLYELERSLRFARICSDACELNSIEEMLEKRDQLLRDQLIH